LPIGSRINAEGYEIISLTLLGIYGLNSAHTNEGATMTAVRPPPPGVAPEQQQAEYGSQRRDDQGDQAKQQHDQEHSAEAPHTAEGAVLEGQQREETPVQLAREQVRLIQLQLQELGFNPGPADGIFGRRTEAALRHYQTRHTLPITGFPDEETRRSLELQASQAQQRRLAKQTPYVEKQHRTSVPKHILGEVGGFFQKILKRE
jgi:Putative peptidoglycan binding domain